MTVGAYDNRNAAWNSRSANAGDKRVLLLSARADADLAGFARNTFVADVDIATACGKINAGAKAQGDIAVAGGVAKECRKTLARVVGASVLLGALQNRWPCSRRRLCWYKAHDNRGPCSRCRLCC